MREGGRLRVKRSGGLRIKEEAVARVAPRRHAKLKGQNQASTKEAVERSKVKLPPDSDSRQEQSGDAIEAGLQQRRPSEGGDEDRSMPLVCYGEASANDSRGAPLQALLFWCGPRTKGAQFSEGRVDGSRAALGQDTASIRPQP